jgi:glycosyltransferase involved in cell wall biosynthesis
MSTPFPKISIVTPALNHADFLEACMQSVLSQNYPNLEYIVIDGGSTDGSVEIIKKYEQQLHFWSSEPDEGHADALNKGFSHATGDIMAWLNSDDKYCPWAFETVAGIFGAFPQVRWLTTLNPGYWDWHGFCMGFVIAAGFSRESFLDGCHLPPLDRKLAIEWIQQESTFWRRDLWLEMGSYISTEFFYAFDFDLWSKFFSFADLYGTISPLAGFRMQINQKTTTMVPYLAEGKVVLERMRRAHGWSPNPVRDLIRRTELNKLTALKSLIEPLCSYTGKRIARSEMNKRTAAWVLEEYKYH